jgi:TRAP-type C4-dicarboxylate transport system permease small subunit
MPHVGRWVSLAGRGFNNIASSAVILMMMLTCTDVVLRLFRQPIPGTYEVIGFLGTVVASFSLAYTSIEKGHIAVEILVDRLPERAQAFFEALSALIGASLFGLLTWQSSLYATDLKLSGEVSLTLEIPTYLFVYGVAAGCGMLTLVLLVELGGSLRKAARR